MPEDDCRADRARQRRLRLGAQRQTREALARREIPAAGPPARRRRGRARQPLRRSGAGTWASGGPHLLSDDRPVLSSWTLTVERTEDHWRGGPGLRREGDRAG